MTFAPLCKEWLKSIFSSSHDFHPMHLPAIWQAARWRRTSVFAAGENLGGIHFARAFWFLKVSIKITTPFGVVIFMELET